MTELVLTRPDERLRQLSEPVTAPDPDLIDRLIAAALTWEGQNGTQLCAAMSAIQLGVPKQVVIVRTNRGRPSEFEAWYNPHIVDYSGDQVSAPEGCMSVVGPNDYTLRASRVVVEAYDSRFNKRVIEADGYAARMWQHETDHMIGKLFNDPRVKRRV